MASSWFKEFQDRQNQIVSRRTSPDNPLSKVKQVALTQLGADFDPADFVGSKEANGIGEHLLDWGGRALDIISRPGYAVGGLLNDVLKDAVNGPNDENSWAAAWEGLTGRRKEFFSPFQIIDPHQEGESGFNTGARFLVDLIASLGTDPVTYIPGAAIAKGAKTIGDLTGATKVFDKAASSLKPALNATDEIDPFASGAPTTIQDLVEKLRGELPAGPGPRPAIEAPKQPLAIEASRFDRPGTTTLFDMEGITPTPKTPDPVLPTPQGQLPGQAQLPPFVGEDAFVKASEFYGDMRWLKQEPVHNQLAILKITRQAITDALKNTRGKFNASKVKSPWVEDVPEGLTPFPEKNFPEIPKPEVTEPVPFERSAYRHIIKRQLIDDPTTGKAKTAEQAAQLSKKIDSNFAYSRNADAFFYHGERFDFDSWLTDPVMNEGAGDLLSPEGFVNYIKGNPEAKIEGFGTSGVTLPQYTDFFMHPDKINPKATIRKRGKPVNAKAYVTERIAKWEARAKGDPEAITKYEQALAAQNAERAVYEEAKTKWEENLFAEPSKRKPTKAELESFLRENKLVLTADEKKKLLNMANLGNEKGFFTILGKLAEVERKLNVESIKDLAEAAKNGRISQDVIDEIYQKLGAKTPAQAEKKLEAIDKAIARLEEKGSRESAQQVRRFDRDRAKAEQAFSNAHNPEVIGEVPHKIPQPKLPIKETVDKSKRPAKGNPVAEEQNIGIVDDAVTPDVATAISDEDKVRLVDIVEKAVAREWANFKSKYPHKSPKGAGKDEPNMFMGNASWFGEYNMNKQMNFFKDTINRVVAEAKARGINTNKEGLADFKYERVMPLLKANDELLRTYGIHPSTMPGGRGYPISLYDILSSLPENYVKAHLFNAGRQIQPTDFLQLAHLAMNVKIAKPVQFGDELLDTASDLTSFRDEAKGLLSKDIASGGKSARQYAVTLGHRAAAAEIKKTAKTHGFDPKNPPGNFIKDAEMRFKHVAARIFQQSLDPVSSEEFVKKIQAKVAYNSDRANIQYGEFVSNHIDQNVKRLMHDFGGAKTNKQVLEIVDRAVPTTKKATVENSAIIPPVGGIDDVADTIEGLTANPSTAISSAQTKAYANATTKNETVQAGVKGFEATEDYIRTFPTVNLSVPIEMGMFGRILMQVFPHLSEGPLRNLLLSRNVTAGHLSAQFSIQLGKFERRVGKPRVKQLWEDVRLGNTPIRAEDQADYDELVKIVSRIFDDTAESPKNWSLKGNGITPALLNSNLRHFKINERFKLVGETPDEMYRSWRNWENVNDPMDLLSRYHAAVMKSYAEKTFGEALASTFGSPTAQEGFVRITADRGSRLIHLIDTTKYYPEEIARNMRAMDNTLKELAKPGTSNKLAQLFDSATHAYKTGLTIYRPGHHMRNLYGDIWLGAMDGVYSPRYYNQALKVLATRKNHYADYTFDSTLSDLTNGTNTALSFKKGTIKLDNNDVYRLATKHGLLPDYRTIEDLDVGTTATKMETGSKLNIIRAPFGGKVHRVASDVSEVRDHYVRIAHFLKTMEDLGKSAKFGSTRASQLAELDRIAEIASTRVRKWHPNGSDLTQFEKKVLRRGILFYSWIRKAIPLVVETYFTRPGRFLMFPKAMYELAEANGIDLNGFTDPFPTDQLFPAWMGGMQGPQFGNALDGYIAMRPGVPQMDIMDQYFTSPGETFQTIMGATHPFAKVPYELVTGASTQGVPIKDTGKYLLGQVPFGNLVNTTVGKPIGGVSPSDEGYDPGGIRDPAAMAWVNMLTGLGLMDMSKPSYIKSGEFDQKYGRI